MWTYPARLLVVSLVAFDGASKEVWVHEPSTIFVLNWDHFYQNSVPQNVAEKEVVVEVWQPQWTEVDEKDRDLEPESY